MATEPGDRLKGKVTRTAVGRSSYGEYPIVELEPDEGGGALSVHAFHQVFANELAKLDVKPGMRIGIKYLGETAKENGSGSYHDYVVATDEPEPEFDWARFRSKPDDPDDDAPSGSEVPADTQGLPDGKLVDDDESVPFWEVCLRDT
jgi:hypothetical protein